jgi:hypothetical protein
MAYDVASSTDLSVKLSLGSSNEIAHTRLELGGFGERPQRLATPALPISSLCARLAAIKGSSTTAALRRPKPELSPNEPLCPGLPLASNL